MAIELTPQQKDILIRTALGEARGEGVEGMADVIQVIFNRAQSGQYPSDPAAVALQPYQFSTWNRGEGGNNPQQFKPSDPIYRKAAEALEMVVSGERPDYTGGALFYHTPAVNPNWAGEVNKFGTIQRNGHIFYPSRPVPPGEIPNVVASKLDTTPQTRNVPLPRPRPTPPSMPTPRQQRLPDIGSTSSPVGPGPTSLASVQDMYGRPQTNRLDPIGLGPLSLANVQGMYGRGGVGLPPATRSVPSVPVRPAMNAIGTMPSFGQFQAQLGRPAVATQLATARPVIGFPTPVSQRPAQRTIGFPTPANMRPAMAQPQRTPLQVTVQGANSYNAPQPQSFAGTSSGRSYTAGQSYTMGGDTYVANPDGSFTNTRTGRRLAGSSGGQSSQRSSSGPAQSLV